MKSVTFEDSLFEECYFEDITSSNTFFKNCTFISTVFYNTGGPGGPRAGAAEMGVTPPTPFLLPPDLFEYKFINSRVLNSTFLHNKEGCQLDFSDDNNAYMIYFVSFLGTLAVLPGNIVSALLMDKIGRLRMLGGCWVLGVRLDEAPWRSVFSLEIMGSQGFGWEGPPKLTWSGPGGGDVSAQD